MNTMALINRSLLGAFTGSDVKNILRNYGFPNDQRIFHVGTSLEYERIF